MNKQLLAYRSSTGLGFINSPPAKGKFENFAGDSSSNCRDMAFSRDGKFFAWCNAKVTIISTDSCKVICELPVPRTTAFAFSPCSTYVATWQPYIVHETPQDSCNLFIWRLQDGICVKSFIQKRQANWCPDWTDDEHLCARNVSNEVHFFKNGNFDQIEKKIFMQKVVSFSLAPGPADYHIACYVPGVKGQPSFIRMFKFPNFDGAAAVIAQRSFFKADRAECYWNTQGSSLLVQAIVDVDKSGSSYYGEQNLYYLNTKGETAKVMLGKDGPVYSVKWRPNGKEFCVVYGFMPAKASIYNCKCEAVFDFGLGSRNEVHFSTATNRMILCGFGNLRGNIEVWDLQDKKQISNFTASDSTHLAWSPDGEYILTATTYPRLKIGNGYRFWHYTGSLLVEEFLGVHEELYDMKWMPIPEDNLKVKATQYVPVPGIESAQPQASKQVYRPPGARGQPSSFRLHDDELAKTLASGNDKPLTRNQKKKMSKKNKKKQEGPISKEEEKDDKDMHSPDSKIELTSDVEKDKRIRNLSKKLDQIKKLKEEQESGKSLEKSQVDKINKEDDILEELRKLKL